MKTLFAYLIIPENREARPAQPNYVDIRIGGVYVIKKTYVENMIMYEPVAPSLSNLSPLSETLHSGDRIFIADITSPLNNIYIRVLDLLDHHEKAQIISQSFSEAAQQGNKADQTSHPSEFNFKKYLDRDTLQDVELAYITALFRTVDRYRSLLKMCAPDHQLPEYHHFMDLMIKDAKAVMSQAKLQAPNTPDFEMTSGSMMPDEKKDPLRLSLVGAFQAATDAKIMLLDTLTTCLFHEAARAEFLMRAPAVNQEIVRFVKGVNTSIDDISSNIFDTEKLQKAFVRYIQMRPVLGQHTGLVYH